ncbi:type II secretion system F family protein [Kineosporia sp. A_224]|uniref:type II secretion system F family protein n=1 Tax=Kineosporia sp. A_224 TaxID=1962180 RepID=UPI000B4B33A3|nr:type II secretion system F family protein [Kineosporia sp. A_224]
MPGLHLGVLAAALCAAGVAAGLVLLVAGLRGRPVDAGRPDSRPDARVVQRLGQARAWVSSPAVSGRFALGAVAGVATVLFTGWPVAAAAVAVLLAFWPQLFGGRNAEQGQIARLEALVVWTESLRDTIAAHASLEQAIPASTATCPPLIRPALSRLAGQIRARAPMDTALLGLAAELDDPSADLVCAALILNVRRRGDRLAEVLGGLAAAAREELDMRRRVSAGRAGLRRGVQIVILMTVVFAGFLILFGGDYVKPYDTLAGQIALLVVVALFATGFAWMRKLAADDPVAAFLNRPGRPAWTDPAEVRLVASLTGLSAAAVTSRLGADHLADRSAGVHSVGVR